MLASKLRLVQESDILTCEKFCLFFRNTHKIVTLLGNGIDQSLIPHHINLTQASEISAEDYDQIIEVIKKVQEGDFAQLGLETCSIEAELNKVLAKIEKNVHGELDERCETIIIFET